jgi:precorrin-2 dehydrogenase / sirohydrochlorin ferrochelatase
LSSAVSREKHVLLPIFLKLATRRCLVVGAGKAAEEKIQKLLACDAVVHVVAMTATPKIQAWARNKNLLWDKRRFESQDLDGVFLAVLATSSKAVNRGAYEEAQHRGILCNTARDRSYCNFYFPSVVRRGPLQIAISTAGHSGALAQRLREELEREFGPEWEDLLRWLGEARSSLYSDALSPKQRRTMLHKMASRKMQEEMFRRWGVLPEKKFP